MSEAATEEQAPQTPVEQSTPTSFQIPQEYSNRGWAEKVKSYNDLFKAYDNAQSLIGKRPEGIPTKDAPPQEWDKFYTALGRPEKPDAYELKTQIEGLPEGFDPTPYEQKAKTFFHKLGLPPEKANQAWNDYLAMELEGAQQTQLQYDEKQKALDVEFANITKTLWGDKYNDVSARAQEFIKTALPEELRPAINEISENPKALAAVIKLSEYAQSQISETKAKYGAEDKLASGQQPSGMSQQEILGKMNELRETAKKSDPYSQKRKSAYDEIENLRKKLALFVK